MSRVGRQPVAVPSGVKIGIANQLISVEGPKGRLEYGIAKGLSVAQENNSLVIKVDAGASRQTRADYGSIRAHIQNMVIGVTTGWKRSLELNGVGYTASIAGQKLELKVGFSHEVIIDLPKAVKGGVVKNVIELESHDKQLLGVVASGIRKIRPPEPYLGKGIKHTTEKIRRKAGKTGK